MEPYEIEVDFVFHAARRLAHLPDGHPCRNLHGHTFRGSALLAGRLRAEAEWVEDFGVVEEHLREEILQPLDHVCLNDVPGLERPTTENVARWIYDRLARRLPRLSGVRLSESPTTRCLYRGNA